MICLIGAKAEKQDALASKHRRLPRLSVEALPTGITTKRSHSTLTLLYYREHCEVTIAARTRQQEMPRQSASSR